MESIKSPKFILLAMALIGAFVLAAFKVVTGTECLTFCGGLLAGVGVAATGVKKAAATLLPVALLLSISGCAHFEKTVKTADRVLSEACKKIPAAHLAATALCGLLPQSKQRKCLDNINKGKRFLDAGAAVGKELIGSCPNQRPY